MLRLALSARAVVDVLYYPVEHCMQDGYKPLLLYIQYVLAYHAYHLIRQIYYRGTVEWHRDVPLKAYANGIISFSFFQRVVCGW